jgi:hypothetical protein
MKTKTEFLILGFVALLVIKYLVVGLDAWNGVFHPDRVEGKSLDAFRKPLLGVAG